MENAPFWFVFVAAVAIPVGNAIFAGILGLVAAHVGRNATKYAADLHARETRIATEYAANLAAAQRRRDVEIAQIREAQTALLTAATAVQAYAWYANKRVSRGGSITTDEWEESRPLIEPAINGAQYLRGIAPTLPTDALRDVYIEVERLIFKVVSDGVHVWNAAVEKQPAAIPRAISLTAEELKRLMDTYPGESPPLSTAGVQSLVRR